MERNENISVDLEETNEADIEIETHTYNKRRNSHNAYFSDNKSRNMKKDVAFGKFMTDEKEDICKNCGKLISKYRKITNECIYHSRNWNGFDYECCGNKNKYSSGCKTGSHITENEETQKKMQEICSNCKAQGHESKHCPLDPNARSGENPVDELSRIKGLRINKTSQRFNKITKYKIKEDSFADITMLKNSVCREKTYKSEKRGERKTDVNDTNDSSISFYKKKFF